MEIGEVWAYRERVSDTDCPAVPAEVLQFGPARSQKVRVRFQGGEYPGLDSWVTKRRLLVLWDAIEAWLRDERNFNAAWNPSLQPLRGVEHEAALLVSRAYQVGEFYVGWDRSEGATVTIDDLDRVGADLGVGRQELMEAPLAYVDRGGTYVAPWPVALRLVRRAAELHPADVLAVVKREEDELRSRATHGWVIDWGGRRGSDRPSSTFVPPEECVEDLRSREPVFARVREWCGTPSVRRFDEAVALRGAVTELRKLGLDAAKVLEERGFPRDARRLQRELDRRTPAD